MNLDALQCSLCDCDRKYFEGIEGDMVIRHAALMAWMALGVTAGTANASTIVGGITFQDNAFADTLIASSGDYSTSGGSLASVLVDNDASTYAFSYDVGAFITLGFADNTVVNGSGADLALFELGEPDSFNVTLNGITLTYLSMATGYHSSGGFEINVAEVDLSAFGIAAGSSIDQVTLSFLTSSDGTIASTSLVGAINSGSVSTVPLPASAPMFGAAIFGLAGIGYVAKRKKSATRA